MSIELLILIVLLLVVVALIWIGLKLHQSQTTKSSEAEMEKMVHTVFGLSATKVAEQSKQILESERSAISVDLHNKHQMLEKMVTELQQELQRRQTEIRELEKDRSNQFARVSQALEEQRKLTEKLESSTQTLATVLSNNQTRGAWGERIIEDLLRTNGLVEGIHYSRQTTIEGTSLKPDILLLLPNKRSVPVDVKFPYSEIQKMALATTPKAKTEHLRQFASDLKLKVKKVAEYISPDGETLDYAIMFVPNEMVFSFINEKFPDIVDEALRQRVIIVSPFTFIVVARTVLESYRNFMLEDRLQGIIKHIDGFIKEWTLFRDEFEKFGRAIDTLSKGYQKLTTTRTAQMERRVAKVIEEHQGSSLSSGTESTSELIADKVFE